MRNISSLVMAVVLYFSAGVAVALDCNGPFWDDQKGKLRWCTAQEKQQQYENERLENARYAAEMKIEAQKRERLSSISNVSGAIGVVVGIVAMFLGFGIIGSLGWFALIAFGPVAALEIGAGDMLVAGGPSSAGAMLVAVGGAIAVLFGFWHRSENRKDRRFESNLDAMTYSRDGLNINLDKERSLLIVNGLEIAPSEYSYSQRSTTKKVSFNTGGNQTVYGSGGAIGTVYVPGESGSYHEAVGLEVEIKKSGSVVAKASFTLHKDAAASSDALLKVLAKIQAWCDEAKQGSAKNVLDALCQQAGMESDYFSKSYCDKQGVLRWAIAADRNGKAVAIYNDGADTWTGVLKGASAQIIDSKLEVKVDDAAYREQHLSERRFVIMDKEPREVLVEWEDRINLLAKK